MGKELTNQGTINSYEMINHKSDIFLWLHQVLDDVKTIKFASFENLVNAVYDLLSDAFTPEDSSMIGEVKMWSAATAPDKWLLCNGVAISRTTYSTLFALIGSTYGEGDGTTTFNLPDFRGRAPVGAGQGSGLTNRVLGDILGEEAHALISGENASHTHTGPSHTHPGPAHTHSMTHTHVGGAHTHGVYITGVSTGGYDSCYAKLDTSRTIQSLPGGDVPTSGASTSTTGSSGTGNTGSSGTGNTSSSGSGTGHNTMQPSIVINFIIYAGVSEL